MSVSVTSLQAPVQPSSMLMQSAAVPAARAGVATAANEGRRGQTRAAVWRCHRQPALPLRLRAGARRVACCSTSSNVEGGRTAKTGNESLGSVFSFFPLLSWPDASFATRRTLGHVVRLVGVLVLVVLLSIVGLLVLDSTLLLLMR